MFILVCSSFLFEKLFFILLFKKKCFMFFGNYVIVVEFFGWLVFSSCFTRLVSSFSVSCCVLWLLMVSRTRFIRNTKLHSIQEHTPSSFASFPKTRHMHLGTCSKLAAYIISTNSTRCPFRDFQKLLNIILFFSREIWNFFGGEKSILFNSKSPIFKF